MEPLPSIELRQELRDRIVQLQLVAENLPLILWTADQDQKITSAWGAGLAFFKKRSGVYTRQSPLELFQEEAERFMPFSMQQIAASRAPLEIEVSLEKFVFEVHLSPVFDPTGAVSGCNGVALDITDRKKAETALRSKEKWLQELLVQMKGEAKERKKLLEESARLAAIVDSATEAIIGKTLEGVITSWNAGAERLYGYAAQEMIGQHISSIVPEDRKYELAGIIEKIKAGQCVQEHDTIRRHKSGRELQVSVSISPVRHPNGSVLGASAIARDVTRLKQAEARLRELAHKDFLTDLANGRYFTGMLERCLLRTQKDVNHQFAVMFMDLDDFKRVNDQYGHAAGDRLLTELGRILRACSRPGDLPARLGGDEFAILVMGVSDREQLERIADRIQRRLCAWAEKQSPPLFAGVSIGVATGHPNYVSAKALLRDADQAMYAIKKQRKRLRRSAE